MDAALARPGCVLDEPAAVGCIQADGETADGGDEGGDGHGNSPENGVVAVQYKECETITEILVHDRCHEIHEYHGDEIRTRALPRYWCR
jgi:hypothetical protein